MNVACFGVETVILAIGTVVALYQRHQATGSAGCAWVMYGSNQKLMAKI
jgi:hypothetical protein